MCYRDLFYNQLSRPARLAFGLQPASWAALLQRTSLESSYPLSFLLSEVGRADFKQSGLRRSVVSSATQYLAYFPCRIGNYGSIFCFFVGGSVSKKAPPPARPPRLFSPHQNGKFAASSQTSYQGAFLCCLKTITKLQMCFGLTLVSFTRRRPNELRTGPIVLRSEVGRRSSLMLHFQHNQACRAGNSSCPVAARRAAFFPPNRALTASARITAASPSSRVVSSRSNHRSCFLTKPNSACRTPSPTTAA